MKVPFIVLSYGQFKKSKKLFSYERDGVHTLPIFSDPATAAKFSTGMTKLLRKHFKDKRTLHTQVCTDQKMALSIFETVIAFCPDLMRVVVNPTLKAGTAEGLEPTVLDIGDVMDGLHELAEKGEPESKTE